MSASLGITSIAAQNNDIGRVWNRRRCQGSHPVRRTSVSDISPAAGQYPAEAVATIRRLAAVMEAQAPAHKLSILQDLERGRRLEIEETLGYAVRKGLELDVPLPTIDACSRR